MAESQMASVTPQADRDLATAVDRYLAREIEVGSFPGAVYAIGSSSGVTATNALGHSVLKPAKIFASIDTIYDVASLTKPLITTTVVLRTAARGMIDLNERVSKYLPELAGTDKEQVTFIDLLTHRGGFQAWYPLYAHGLGSRNYLAALARRPLRYKPGTREIYSCLGFILLHLAMERVHGRPAEELAQTEVFEPLGLTQSGFNPPPEKKYVIAATEWGNANERKMIAERGLSFPHYRNYIIWGEVDDGNAWYMGGFAGNAGLFSTARDVFTIAQAYLRRDERLLPAELYALANRNYTLGLEENRGLGWQLPGPKANGPATMFSEGAFGHTGFTGTSVWVDPQRDLVIVLLTNRIHPHTQTNNMQTIRRGLHQLVVDLLD